MRAISHSQTQYYPELGTLIDQYVPKDQSSRKIRIWLAATTVITFIGVVFFCSLDRDISLLVWLLRIVLFEGMLLFFTLPAIALILLYRSCALYLYEHGAIEQIGSWQWVAEYSEIKVWERIVDLVINGKKWPTSKQYSVQFPKAWKHPLMYLTDGNGYYHPIAEKLMQLVCQAQLPGLTEAFQSGETVRFGNVFLNRDGIKIGSQSFIWSDGYSVKLQNGTFTVKQGKGSFLSKQASISYSSIPNVYVFVELLRSIQKLVCA